MFSPKVRKTDAEKEVTTKTPAHTHMYVVLSHVTVATAFFFFLMILGTVLGSTLCIGKHSTTELYSPAHFENSVLKEGFTKLPKLTEFSILQLR